MSPPTYQDESLQLPGLIPINPKNEFQTSSAPQPDENQKQPIQHKNQERHDNMQDPNKKNSQPVISKDEKRLRQQSLRIQSQDEHNIASFSQKFMNIQETTSANTLKATKKSQQEKKEENQKSKFLIAEMLNKISAKNISEQLYPITNETIERVLLEMEEEIQFLKTQAQNKDNALQMNPQNKDLELEVKNIKKSIDHCVMIKELYNEKINSRNKIAILQGKILQLKAENRGLKITVSKGIEKIQNHIQNLPSQKEKQLKEELKKVVFEKNKEKQMRINLENKNNEIIMDFKRLYDEADTARMVVVKKLKQIQDREKKLIEARNQLYMDVNDQQASNSIKKSPKLQYLEEKRGAKGSTENETQRFRQPYNKSNRDSERTEREKVPGTIDKKQQKKPISMEDHIKKMRGNKSMLSKIYNRN